MKITQIPDFLEDAVSANGGSDPTPQRFARLSLDDTFYAIASQLAMK